MVPLTNLPPSRFFDLPPKALRARTRLNLTHAEVRRRVGDSTNRAVVSASSGAEMQTQQQGLSNTPYSPADSSQLLELSIRPASVKLRVRPARKYCEYEAGYSGKREYVKRGRIREFSEKSRLNLQLFAADLQVIVQKPNLMVTLTYPGEWRSVTTDWNCRCEASEGCSDVPCICDFSPSGKVAKRHLDLFQKRVTRFLKKFGITDWGCLWFLEFQTRGAPHFHLLFFGLAGVRAKFPLPVLMRWCSRNWVDIVGHDDPVERKKHLNSGTRVEHYRSAHFGYALKYAAKLQQKAVPAEFADIGRFWGCWNDPTPSPELRAIYTSSKTLKRIAEPLYAGLEPHSERFAGRVYGRLCTATPKDWFTFTLFGASFSRFFTSYGRAAPLTKSTPLP